MAHALKNSHHKRAVSNCNTQELTSQVSSLAQHLVVEALTHDCELTDMLPLHEHTHKLHCCALGRGPPHSHDIRKLVHFQLNNIANASMTLAHVTQLMSASYPSKLKSSPHRQAVSNGTLMWKQPQLIICKLIQTCRHEHVCKLESSALGGGGLHTTMTYGK